MKNFICFAVVLQTGLQYLPSSMKVVPNSDKFKDSRWEKFWKENFRKKVFQNF